jgi:hypothetical protein
VEATLRPHRGGTVLALGILSLIGALFLIPLGIVAWILGSKDLKAMDAGLRDPSGRTLTQVGYVFGIAATLVWLGFAGCAVLMMNVTVRESNSSGSNGQWQTKTYYPHPTGADVQKLVEWEYQEVELPDGTRAKQGPAIHWSPDGKKLEEGSYTGGKRDGSWTFRNPDGSIDKDRSGVYQNDVRIGPSPLGDFTDTENR